MRIQVKRACGWCVVLHFAFLHFALAFAVWAESARADWLNTTGAETAQNFAEIDILDGRVRVTLEIDFPDYPAFVPDRVDPATANVEPNTADLSPATGTAFKVEANGSAIVPQIRAIEIRDRKPRPTAQPAAAAPQKRGARVIAVELGFPFLGRPEALTFTPPRDDNGKPIVNLGFLATHNGVPVTDYRYLSGAERLVLDWDDPWYSAFENPNLTRHHRAALMSFVSIEPRELRHEIVFRLRDLEGWTDLNLGTTDALDAAQIEDIKEKARRFFAGLDPVVTDGQERHPKSVRIVFLKIGTSGVRIVEDEEGTDRVTALLGAVLSYPHRTLPQKLGMTWQLFTDRAQEVPVSVADPAGAVPGRVTPDAPEITWTNFLRTWEDPAVSPVVVSARRELGIPILSILLFAVAAAFAIEGARARRPAWWAVFAVVAGAGGLAAIRGPALNVKLPGGPDEKVATEITQGIVRNAGVAMLETEPKSFNTALESFVVRDDMEPIGAEMRRGLSVRLPTGARALTDTIGNVNVEEVNTRDDGVTVLARWTAQMSGGHWGHLHRRQIDYRALMDLTENGGVWCLRGLTVLSAKPKATGEPSI